MKRAGIIVVGATLLLVLTAFLRRIYELSQTKSNYIFKDEPFHSWEPELPARLTHVPLVFYYKNLGGLPEFDTLQYTAEVALEQNSEVVMLTDHREILEFGKEDIHENVDFQDLSLYDERSDKVQAKFVESYKPKTRDPKRIKFEMACIQRYLSLRALLHKRGWDALFHLDNDVLAFSNMTKVWPSYQRRGCDLVISIPWTPGEHPNAGSSFWTKKALDKFAEWVLELYSPGKLEEWMGDWKGDITDMIVLMYFTKHMMAKPGSLNVCNGLVPVDGGVLNHRTGIQGGYFRYLLTEDVFRSFQEPTLFFDPILGRPYFYASKTQQLLKWHTLHMAGDAENNVPKVVCGPYSGIRRRVCERAATRRRWALFLLFLGFLGVSFALSRKNSPVRRWLEQTLGGAKKKLAGN